MAEYCFPYPPELTKKAWDKNKGTFAKLAVGKTDIGKCLASLEEAFQLSGFEKIEDFPGFDPLDYTEYETKLRSLLKSGLTDLETALEAVSDACKKAVPEIEKAKMPKSSTEKTLAYVKKITDSVDWMEAQVSARYIELTIGRIKNEYTDRLKKSNEALGIIAAAETSAKTFADILLKISEALGVPTLENFHKVFNGNGPHRQLTTTFKTWDQFTKSFERTAKKIYSGNAMKEFGDLPCLKDVANETSEHASKKIKALLENGGDEKTVVKKYLKLYEKSVIEAQVISDHFKKLAAILQRFSA